MAKTQKIFNETAPINKEIEREILLSSRIGTPEATTIEFRQEANVFERPVIEVPLELLKYRKENCRISEYVLDASVYDDLNPDTVEDQEKLHKFLWEQDKSLNENLLRDMKNRGQEKRGIATADGFMVDGNRRLCVLREMQKKDTSITHMKITLLPGNPDVMKETSSTREEVKQFRVDNGLPKIEEIESTENRIQNKAKTDAPYSDWAKAQSFFKRLNKGISLEAQLREHSDKQNLSDTEMKKEIRTVENNLIEPRKLVDQYLEYIGAPGSVLLAVRGPESLGFDAFQEHYKKNIIKVKNEESCIKNNFDENERAEFIESCWKMMRVASPLKEKTKIAQNIREFFNMWQNKDCKKVLKNTLDDIVLTDDSNLDPIDKERKYKNDHQKPIKQCFNHASNIVSQDKEKSTPLKRIGEALSKLSEKVELSNMPSSDRDEAVDICNQIQRRTREIINEIEIHVKKLNKLTKK